MTDNTNTIKGFYYNPEKKRLSPHEMSVTVQIKNNKGEEDNRYYCINNVDGTDSCFWDEYLKPEIIKSIDKYNSSLEDHDVFLPLYSEYKVSNTLIKSYEAPKKYFKTSEISDEDIISSYDYVYSNKNRISKYYSKYVLLRNLKILYESYSISLITKERKGVTICEKKLNSVHSILEIIRSEIFELEGEHPLYGEDLGTVFMQLNSYDQMYENYLREDFIVENFKLSPFYSGTTEYKSIW